MQLSKEELEKIEKEFAKQFERNPEKMIAQYRDEHCNKLNWLSSDKATELCPTYKETPLEQRRFLAASMSIRETAQAITSRAFDQLLKESPPAGLENLVTFVCGGAGAGKSHVIRNNWAAGELITRTSHIVFETVSGLKEMNIERVLNAGKDAVMLYVHRPIEQAAVAVLDRVEREGRAPSLNYVCKEHFGSPQRMSMLTQLYKEHNGIYAAVVDNRFTGQPPKFVEPNAKAILEFLKINAYKDTKKERNKVFHTVQRFIKDREKEGRPIEKDLKQHYIGREQEARTKQAQQLLEQRGQDPDKT